MGLSNNLPSQGWSGRSQTVWQGYRGLRRRSRFSSMTWWGYKLIQGLIFGGGLIVFGLLLILIYAAVGGVWLPRLGMLLAVIGVLVIVRYAAAPLTARWTVNIPENWIYVVEDSDGYTLEYLGPGRWVVPFRTNVRVVEYVNFNSIRVDEVVEDVLDSHSLPVDLEVSVALIFNPVEADPAHYATLRKMTTPEQFQKIVARDLRDLIHSYLNSLTPPQGGRATLRDIESLETVILGALDSYAPLGLFPAPNRPVMVRVVASKQIKGADQELLARAARMREQAQTIGDIKRMAQELGIPFEDAFQLLYLLQYGAPAQPTSRTRRYQEPPTQPVVILRQVAPNEVAPLVSPEPAPPQAQPTLTDIDAPTQPRGVPIQAAQPAQPVPTPPPAPTVIERADLAPDPMDLRRQRKADRRSRRVE